MAGPLCGVRRWSLSCLQLFGAPWSRSGFFSVGLTASVIFPWPFYVFLHSLECFIPVLLSLKPLLCWVGQNLPALDLGQETKTFCFFFFFFPRSRILATFFLFCCTWLVPGCQEWVLVSLVKGTNIPINNLQYLHMYNLRVKALHNTIRWRKPLFASALFSSTFF